MISGNHKKNSKHLPEIDASRCLHASAVNSSCKKCVDACSVKAWQLDDESLSLDIDLCTGCNLCIPACPQGAITHNLNPLIGMIGGERISMLACEKSGLEGEGVYPCINALASKTLLELQHKGIHRILLNVERCSNCLLGKADHLDFRIEKINALLGSRKMKSIVSRLISTDEWRKIRDILSADMGQAMSRRAFFRKGIETVAHKSEETPAVTESNFQPKPAFLPTDYLQPIKPGNIAIFLPDIIPNLCIGCDACAKVCTTEAIRLDKKATHSCYRIAPDQCNGCGLCEDVCEESAVTIKHWSVFKNHAVKLAEGNCSACGVKFHYPEYRGVDRDNLCQICSRKNHYKTLYQILD